jgi:hypothetical protein
MQPTQPPEPPAPETPHYLQTSAKANDALDRRAGRDLIFGPLWIAFGLIVTLYTLSLGGAVFLVAWGPVVWGGYLIFRGVRARNRH